MLKEEVEEASMTFLDMNRRLESIYADEFWSRHAITNDKPSPKNRRENYLLLLTVGNPVPLSKPLARPFGLFDLRRK